MPERLGLHAPRLAGVRALLTPKGRAQSGRFSFEGPTLLEEARRSGRAVEELYVTQAAYDSTPAVRDFEAAGVPVFLVEERSAAKISDLEAPPGIVAVAAMALTPPAEILAGEGVTLVLADLNDPGNAGTLLRSADAFGCRGAIFGDLGAEPYHPKVVRSSMGAIFRVPVAVCGPEALAEAARAAGAAIVGLSGAGEPLSGLQWPSRTALLVGHERRGLGRWEGLSERLAAIPMRGAAESLNAAIAGSIALFTACQESIHRAKSQDYRR